MKELTSKIKALTARVEALELSLKVKDQQIAELQALSKDSYLDLIFRTKKPLRMKYVAKDYGMSQSKFINLLHSLGISDFMLSYKFITIGYVRIKKYHYFDKNGSNITKYPSCWTQKGRLYLYDLLKQHGVLPLMER